MPPARRFTVEILGDSKGAKRAVKETEDSLGRLSVRGRVAGQGLSVIGTGLKGLGVAALGFGVVAGAALGAAAKSVVTLGIQYQDQLNNMQAVTHSTDAVMGRVADTARALGNDLSLPATSAADAAQAMTELAKGGLTAQQAMAAAKGTLQLAAAAQIDGAAAAQTQVQALNAFALSADKAGHVSDVLANAANSATGEISDFALGLAQSGAVAHQFGISLDDTVTALAELANAGIKGSDAGTSLKSGLLALASPSKQAAAALRTLGVNAYDSNHQFVGLRTISEQLAAAHGKLSQQAFNSAVSIAFGSDAARVAGVLAKDGAAGFDQMSASIGKSGGAAEVAQAKMKGVGGALRGLQSQVETVKIDVFTKAAPSLEAFIRRISADLPKAADAGLRALDRLFGFVAEQVPKAQALVRDFGPDVQVFVGDKLRLAGQVAEQVFAPALRGAVTVLRAVADEAVRVGGTVGGGFQSGLQAAARVAHTFEGEASSLASTVHEVGTSISAVARDVLPALKVGLEGAGVAASVLLQSMSGAARIVAPFAGEILLAVVAVKSVQLAMAGFGAVSGAVDKVTSAWGRFADATSLKVGVGVESMAKRLGSDLPTAAARGEKAMTDVRSAFTKVGSALPIVGVGLLAVGFALEQQQRQAAEAEARIRGYYDALRQGGQASVDAQRNIQSLQDRLASLQQQAARPPAAGPGAMAFALAASENAKELAKQLAAAKKASDEAFQSLSVQDQQQVTVTKSQNDLALAIEKYGVDSSQAAAANRTYQSALRDQKNLQDALSDATNRSKTSLADYTNAVLAAAGSSTALASQEISVRQSSLELASASARAADAVRQHGKSSTEARAAALAYQQAEITLRGQILSAAEAARAAAVANDRSGSSAHAAEAGARAQRAELAKLAAGLAPNSPLRRYLAGLIAQLDNAARERVGSVRIVVHAPAGITVGSGAFKIEARAAGGPVAAGQPYLVGERGRPELFVPDVPGRIIPDVPRVSRSGRAAGGTVININVTVSPLTNPAQVGQAVAEALRAYKNTGGKIPA